MTSELDDLVAFVRVSERVRAQLIAALHMTEALIELVVVEEFLRPEIDAAVEHVQLAAEALTRTVVALDARYDSRWNTTKGSG